MDEQELIKEGKRTYMRNYMRAYRRKHKDRIKEHTNNFFLRQGIHTLQVAPSLYELEKEIEELKYKV